MGRVHGLTRVVLARLQEWLARPQPSSTHLVVVTRGAVSVGAADGSPDLAQAAVWALLHSAQNEHPGRISVVDSDDTAASAGVLLGWPPRRSVVLSRSWRCAQGVTYLPRLARVPVVSPPPSPPVWDRRGTVLITGGTGMLGGVFAEHLVSAYGVRQCCWCRGAARTLRVRWSWRRG